jgi:hypothetical protein
MLALGLLGPLGLPGLLGGCGATPQNGETLIESVRTFNDGVRWQRYSAAAARLPAAERSAFVDEWDQRSTDLKVTDYDVVRVSQDGERRAKIQVKIAWYRDSEGTLRETHALQTWEQHGKAWFLMDARRLRGAEMPGLAEPLTPAKDPDADSAATADGGPEAPATPRSARLP